MIKYLLFDLDRTLWDFDGNAEVTFRELYRQFRLQELCGVSFEVFHDYYVQVNNMLWESYRNGAVYKEQLSLERFRMPLEHFGQKNATRLALQLSDYYVKKGTLQTGLMEGARELLDYLQGLQRGGVVPQCAGVGIAHGEQVGLSLAHDFQMGIVTNGFSEAQRPKMRTADIERYFSWFFLSEEVGYMKPDVRFFRAVQHALQCEADEVLVVGDDFRVDIEGAQQAGMYQVYYNYRHSPLPAGSKAPTYMVYNLLEMISIVDAMWCSGHGVSRGQK